MSTEIVSAIKQICDEKGLSYEAVVETIESALAAAYRKDFGEKNQNIKVVFDPEDGKSKVYDIKTVVEYLPEEEEVEVGESGIVAITADNKKQIKTKEKTKPAKVDHVVAGLDEEGGEIEERKFNPKTQIQLSEAKLLKKTAKIDDEIKTRLEIPDSYGRMAAQTAKQVIIQKLREAERDMIFNNFKGKEHEVIAGVVQRMEGRVVLVDLDKTVGILPPEEQIYGEKYNQGDRIKVYVKSVNMTSKGSEIILSRTSDEILKKVFYLEIPEISNSLVEIKALAREAGNRSKVAVLGTSENVDPIGSCVGQRGARIQTIIKELGGEKIDIIEYDEEPIKFIANALAPAKILKVELNEKEKRAVATVSDDQLSLAIGRDGQNVRLAARLTGWKLDLVGDKGSKAEVIPDEITIVSEPFLKDPDGAGTTELKEEYKTMKDVKIEKKTTEKKLKI
ncbi:MAG: transcription termination factor NusA [Patescibacteria group bacterium]